MLWKSGIKFTYPVSQFAQNICSHISSQRHMLQQLTNVSFYFIATKLRDKENYELIIIDPDKNIECWQKEEGREVRNRERISFRIN